MHKLRYILISVLIFALLGAVKAQNFSWQADIPAISEDGFYKIAISPDITSKLKNEYSDIRIFGENDKEIPYIFESEKALEYNDYFVEYKIVDRKEETEWPYYTRLIIHNPKRTKISNIQLLIRNSDVSKTLKLSGSDDRKNWYIIKDSYRFRAMYSNETTSVIKIIDFPLSNYEFFEVLIDDWKNNPINIQKAGYFDTAVDEGKYSKVDKPQINQLEKENEKESIIKVVFKDRPQIDKITFKIDGPEFYYREAEIQVRDSSLNKKKEYEYYNSAVRSISLSSSSLNTFYLNGLKANVLYLRIKNRDNEPLKITEVHAEQLNSYLIAKLSKDVPITLRFGNKKLAAPDYDLKYFKEKVPKNLTLLEASNIKNIKKEKDVETVSGIHLDNAFIWVAIIVVVALLIYMVLKMLKDMKKKEHV